MSIAYLQELAAGREVTLGSAHVVEMAGTTPIVELEGRRRRAELALAFPYQPETGDDLLVIGKGDKCYVIGVLQARGGVALRFLGDVQVHAVQGQLSLKGDRGLRLESDEISIWSKTLKTFAGHVVEKADAWYRRVRNTLDVHSGSKRELVDGVLEVRADKAATLTRGIVTINGKEVHLG